MLKILAKTLENEKILKTATITFDESQVTFYELTKALCEKLDEPTPVILTKHVLDLKKFNICFFKAEDFVESVHFDKLVFQHLVEKR